MSTVTKWLKSADGLHHYAVSEITEIREDHWGSEEFLADDNDATLTLRDGRQVRALLDRGETGCGSDYRAEFLRSAEVAPNTPAHPKVYLLYIPEGRSEVVWERKIVIAWAVGPRDSLPIGLDGVMEMEPETGGILVFKQGGEFCFGGGRMEFDSADDVTAEVRRVFRAEEKPATARRAATCSQPGSSPAEDEWVDAYREAALAEVE